MDWRWIDDRWIFLAAGHIVLRERQLCGARYGPGLRSRRARGQVLSRGTGELAALGRHTPGLRRRDLGGYRKRLRTMPQRTLRRAAFAIPSKQRRIVFRDICGFAAQSFRADRVRATMTALGMVIGTASLILVVTISLTGKQFLLTQINNVGSNLIWAEYSGQSNTAAIQDYLTDEDMDAVQRQVPGIQDRKSTRLNSSHVKISYA